MVLFKVVRMESLAVIVCTIAYVRGTHNVAGVRGNAFVTLVGLDPNATKVSNCFTVNFKSKNFYLYGRSRDF